MAFIPTNQALEFYYPGEPVRDRFGNERAGEGEWVAVLVASWWVDKSDEKAGESVLRTIDMLHVHVPVGFEPPPSGLVRTPDQTEWTIEGNPEDFNHGFHGWVPGLLVLHAKRVEG